jgi:hypothetical protein
MEPFAWIVLASYASLASALLGVVALIARPFKSLQSSGLLYTLVALGINLIVWPIYIWRAPATNIERDVYIHGVVLSAPGFAAATMYPWFGKLRRFCVKAARAIRAM